jgi:hypothetical protein
MLPTILLDLPYPIFKQRVLPDRSSGGEEGINGRHVERADLTRPKPGDDQLMKCHSRCINPHPLSLPINTELQTVEADCPHSEQWLFLGEG